MADDARAGTSPRVPWGLVGAILILAAVESREPGSTNPLADIWADASARAGSEEVRTSAVLCLGDSQIKLGLHAPELGRRIGVPAYNLAVHAGQPAAAHALLRRALDAGARPRAILVGFYPGVLAYEARTNVRQWPEVLGPAEGLDLAIHARDARLAAMTLLGIALPTFKARAEVRREVLAALRGAADPVVAEVARGRRERAENRGSVVAASKPGFLDEPGPTAPVVGSGSGWRPRPENERDVRRLLALAEAWGVAVYWVTPPVSPAERARRGGSGLDAAYEGFLRRLQAEFPALVVLSTHGMGFDRSVFVDPVHLDGRGAAMLTAAVAEAMAGAAPASKWVDLTSPAIADSPRFARGITTVPVPPAR